VCQTIPEVIYWHPWNISLNSCYQEFNITSCTDNFLSMEKSFSEYCMRIRINVGIFLLTDIYLYFLISNQSELPGLLWSDHQIKWHWLDRGGAVLQQLSLNSRQRYTGVMVLLADAKAGCLLKFLTDSPPSVSQELWKRARTIFPSSFSCQVWHTFM